jgi:hypothetical protein
MGLLIHLNYFRKKEIIVRLPPPPLPSHLLPSIFQPRPKAPFSQMLRNCLINLSIQRGEPARLNSSTAASMLKATPCCRVKHASLHAGICPIPICFRLMFLPSTRFDLILRATAWSLWISFDLLNCWSGRWSQEACSDYGRCTPAQHLIAGTQVLLPCS